jgi:hypothetical protein
VADAPDAWQDSSSRRTELEELQRDWLVASAEYSRRAREALTKAADVLADAVTGRTPMMNWQGLGGAGPGLGHPLTRRGDPQYRSRWHRN